MKHRRIIFISLFYFLIPSLGFTQTLELESIRKYADSLASDSQFSGIVLVGWDSTIVLEHTTGFSSRNPDVPIKQNTRFQVASITKQFTAALVLRLFDQYQLDLNTSFGRFLTWYPNSYKDSVSIHHLLSHQSGIPSYTGIPEWPAIASKAFDQKEFVSLFSEYPLEFEPGSAFSYSNSNYYLLGLIAESITGQNYRDLLSDYFFAPLDMYNSGTLAKIEKQNVNFAKGYEQLPNGVIDPAPFQNYTTAFSVSGIYSTGQDLFRWTNALMSGRVIPDSLLQLMTTSWKNGFGYGLVRSQINLIDVSKQIQHPFSAIDLVNGDQSITMVWHWGSNPGFNSFLGYLPEYGLVIICLENITQLNSDRETMIPDLVQKIVMELKDD